MVNTSVTLSNCYTPIPIQQNHDSNAKDSSSSKSRTHNSLSINPTKTHFEKYHQRPTGDGKTKRNPQSLRRICLDTSILSASRGSSLVELGHTKVMASVHGPKSSSSSSSPGKMRCEVRYAPHFGIRPESHILVHPTSIDGGGGGNTNELSSSNLSSEEVEWSARLADALAPSVPLEFLTKCSLEVYVMVLQGDGSVFAACVTAACLALADAGVEMYDLVSACSVAVMIENHEEEDEEEKQEQKGPRQSEEEENGNGNNEKKTTTNHSNCTLLVDPTEEEMWKAEGVVSLTMMTNWKEVTFWDQTGRLPTHIIPDALKLCRDGCSTMHQFMKKALIRSISKTHDALR